MPRTTGDLARSRGAAPSPPSGATAGLLEGGASDLTDDAGAEPTDDAGADTAPSTPPTPPPPTDDPFGLHLLGQGAGDGMPLPCALRSDLEAATGAGLGDVTLHAGARGASTAAAHDARAVTLGREIYFGAGEYAPDDSVGRQLVAHEVAHTVQQQLGPTVIAAKHTDPADADAIDAAEIDADDFAATFAVQGAAAHWRPRATAAGPLRKPRGEETIDRDRLHYIQATKGTRPVNAAAYLQSAYKTLLREIGAFLLGRAITTGHPDLQFIAGSRDFLAKLGLLLDVGEGRDVIARIAECLAPANLYEITDLNRPITDDGESVASLVGAWAEIADDGDVYNDGPRGPRIWQPAVAIAIGSALEAQLAKSMPRMAAQYIAIAERNRQRAVAAGEMPEEVKAAELIPGHPLDWYVARAFAEPPVSVEPAGGKLDADPRAVVEYKKVTQVEWLGPPAPWNAVRAVQPPKASREAMAARLLGSPTEAHRLTKIGDYFVIPEDVAATFPEAARHRPRTRSQQQPTDAVHALGAGALGDQAATVEIDASEAKAPQRGELAALWTAIDERLHGLALVTAKLPGHDLLLGAVAHHAATRAGLDVLGEEEATTRVAVYRAQLQILTEISEDIGALSTHIEQHAAQDPWADRVTAGQKARLTALLRAASLAHLAETGRVALTEARTLEQTQVLDVLDALFADAVGRIEAARHVRDDARLQTQRGEEVFGATLAQRRDLIAQEMADLRTKLRLGTAAPGAIQRLVGKIDGFRFEAMLVANFGAIEQVMNAAEQLESSDWVAAADQIDDLEEIRGAGNRFRMGLSQILGHWRAANRKAKTQLAWIESKGGDPDIEARVFALVDGTLADLRAKLAALGDDAGIQKFLQRAYDEIDDAQTKAAILQIATMIAVTIVVAVASAGVGSLATGAAAGLVGEGLVATGVGIVAESASMSVMTTLINGGEFGDVFVSDVAQNVAMITALRGFDAVFRATRIGQTVGHGASAGRLAYYSAKGVELTGRALVMSGVMYAGAQVESLRKQGRTLTTAEIEAQAAQGIAQVIGTAVLARLAKTPMAQLKALGARGGALARQHVQLVALARQVKRTKDPAVALQLLRAERAQLEGELALWQDLSGKSPAELHRMGVEPELVAAMHGSASQHLTGLDMLEAGTLPAQLGLETVVPGRVFSGTQPKIDAVLASYRKPGVTIETHAEADGSYRYRVLGPDGIPVDLIARPDATAQPRPNGGAATRGASTAASSTPPGSQTLPAGTATVAPVVGDAPSPARAGDTQTATPATTPAEAPATVPTLNTIEGVTGVTKGPEYDDAMTQLRQFYADMEVEAQNVTSVKRYQRDGSYGWDYGHDAQTFSHGLANFAFRVFLKPSAPSVGDPELAALRARVHSGIDRFYNQGLEVPGPDGVARRLHLEVVFVDDPANAHLVVNVHPGNRRADLGNWYAVDDPTTDAHEVAHGAFGIKDEYHDASRWAPADRATPTGPGVRTDQSLMGNNWIWDPAQGKPVIDPAASLKPRHLDEIGAFTPIPPAASPKP